MDHTNDKKRVSTIWLYIALLFILLFILFQLVDINLFSFLRGSSGKLTDKQMATAANVIGLEFTPSELELMTKDVNENLEAYQKLRKMRLDNNVFPAINFNPLIPYLLKASVPEPQRQTITLPDLAAMKIPENLEDLAFASVPVLARLLESQRITSVQLTQMYISRLKRFDPKLKCVITLTEELAMEQAHRADREIAAGNYRGPLHGIPWGVKDLFAVRGIKTTWGAAPYKDQVLNHDATIVKRLDEAGAVLVAKLTTGALAWGDVWYGGKTRNPWNTEQGSSGSSAGPASATSAGLVGFAIGTETWGSIVSPSTRCGVTGLRPTFGRVSRHGAMALSWTMDKVGPICRSAEGCALVFNAVYGPDGKDITLVDRPFEWNPAADIKTLRIGYLKSLFDAEYRNKKNDSAALDVIRSLGVELIPVDLSGLPADVESLGFILNAEAAAAFDELTRSGRDERLTRQVRYAWPNVFRHSRLIPAVEYIQANRYRTLLVVEMAERLKDIDVYIAPSFGGNHLLLTNLTGHPAVVVPNGFTDKGSPTSITFMGNLFKEAETLLLARAYQEASTHHLKRPALIPGKKEKK